MNFQRRRWHVCSKRRKDWRRARDPAFDAGFVVAVVVEVVVEVVRGPGVDADVTEGPAIAEMGGGSDLERVSCLSRSYVRRDEEIGAHMEALRPWSMMRREGESEMGSLVTLKAAWAGLEVEASNGLSTGR